MNTMTHRGYAARIDYSHEDGCFVGHIAGINDVVGLSLRIGRRTARCF